MKSTSSFHILEVGNDCLEISGDQAFCRSKMQIKENNVLIDTCTRFMLTTRFRSFMLLERQTYPRDVVIHHQVGRGPFAPSIMPFAVKLETYLRMVKVPYMVIIVLRSISMDEIRCVGF